MNGTVASNNVTVSGTVTVVAGTLVIGAQVVFSGNSTIVVAGDGAVVVDAGATVVVSLPAGQRVRDGDAVVLVVVASGSGTVEFGNDTSVVVVVETDDGERTCEQVSATLERTPDQRGMQAVFSVDRSRCGGGSGSDNAKRARIIAAIVVPTVVGCALVLVLAAAVRCEFVVFWVFCVCVLVD